MNKNEYSEKSSIFFIGKWVIILSIIVTSSLGFILGYFVGKNSQLEVKDKLDAVPLPGDSSKKEAYSGEAEATKLEQEVIPEKLSQTAPQMKENNNNVVTSKPEDTQEKTPKTQKNDLESIKTHKSLRYCVQVGAFRNSSEADILKEKLIKKGYNAFITQGKTKKEEIIYKVRVGDFYNRKDADILSAKIRKLEGLNSFVTFK